MAKIDDLIKKVEEIRTTKIKLEDEREDLLKKTILQLYGGIEVRVCVDDGELAVEQDDRTIYIRKEAVPKLISFLQDYYEEGDNGIVSETTYKSKGKQC